MREKSSYLKELTKNILRFKILRFCVVFFSLKFVNLKLYMKHFKLEKYQYSILYVFKKNLKRRQKLINFLKESGKKKNLSTKLVTEISIYELDLTRLQLKIIQRI